MYNDEELMMFGEAYKKMMKVGKAGKTIIGSVSERLNESIDDDILRKKAKRMAKVLLECKAMKPAHDFLKTILVREATKKDLAKLDNLYKIYEEEVPDEEKPEEDDTVEEADEDDEEALDPKVATVKAALLNDYKSEQASLYQIFQGVIEFSNWIMTHGNNDERTIIKSLIAILEDEYLPKFAEIPGAKPEDDGAEEGGDDKEADTSADDEEEAPVDDEEPTEEEPAEESEDEDDEEDKPVEEDDEEADFDALQKVLKAEAEECDDDDEPVEEDDEEDDEDKPVEEADSGKYSDELLTAIEDGDDIDTIKKIADALVRWLPEKDVQEFCEKNGIMDDIEEDDTPDTSELDNALKAKTLKDVKESIRRAKK